MPVQGKKPQLNQGSLPKPCNDDICIAYELHMLSDYTTSPQPTNTRHARAHSSAKHTCTVHYCFLVLLLLLLFALVNTSRSA
eukprot:12324-Heterococcus_DN1.PRE.2